MLRFKDQHNFAFPTKTGKSLYPGANPAVNQGILDLQRLLNLTRRFEYLPEKYHWRITKIDSFGVVNSIPAHILPTHDKEMQSAAQRS